MLLSVARLHNHVSIRGLFEIVFPLFSLLLFTDAFIGFLLNSKRSSGIEVSIIHVLTKLLLLCFISLSLCLVF